MREERESQSPSGLSKKLVSFILTLVLIIGMIPATAFAGGAVVTDSADLDVFMNIDPSLGDATEFKGLVEGYLNNLILKRGQEGETYRISTASASIDPTDLTLWEVYDHYDTAHYANGDAWKVNYKRDGFTGSELPSNWYYYKVAESYSYGNNGITSIQQLLKKESPQVWGRTGKLKEHVYAYVDEATGSPAMQFYGYGTVNYADFLYYPASATSLKKVSFDVDASSVLTHALQYAGFLVNTGTVGTGASKKINGYAILFSYGEANSKNPAVSLDKVSLYEFTNVDVNTLHEKGIKGVTSGALLVKESAFSQSETDFWQQSHIALEITDKSLKATIQKLEGGALTGTAVEVFNENNLDNTGYGGFGPYVDYAVDHVHTCDYTSGFRYSNLAMAFTEPFGDDALDAYQYADYLKDSGQTIFVNLTGGKDYAEQPAEEDQAYLSLLDKDKTIVITDAEEGSYLDETPNVYNVNDVKLSNNDKADMRITGELSELEELAAKVALLIYEKKYTTPETPVITPTGTAIAKLQLLDSASTDSEAPWAGAKQVNQIKKELIETGGLKIYLNPDDSDNVEALTPTYKLTDSKGNETAIVPLTDETGKSYFIVDKDWATGDYTVTLSYTLADPITSVIPATATFKVLSDTVAPAVSVSTASGVVLNFINTPSTGANTYTSNLASYAAMITDGSEKPTEVDYKAVNGSTAEVDLGDLPLGAKRYLHAFIRDAAGNESYVMTEFVVPKYPQVLSGTKEYIFELGTASGAALDFAVTSPNEGTLGAISYSEKSDMKNSIIISGGSIIVGKSVGEAVITVTAAATDTHREATEEIKVIVVPPFKVNLNITDYTTSTGITIKPGYKDYPTVPDLTIEDGESELKYRRIGTDEWTTVAKGSDLNWDAPYTLSFGALTAGAEYEISLSGQNHQGTPDEATLIFKVPSTSVGTGTTNVDLQDTEPGVDYTVSIKTGDTVLDSKVVTGSGVVTVPPFTGLDDGYYNIVVEFEDKIITEQIVIKDGQQVPSELKIIVGKKNTKVSLGNDKSPKIVADGLNALFDAQVAAGENSKGITNDDLQEVTEGGIALIELVSKGFDESEGSIQGDVSKINAIKGNQNYAMILDLSLYKKIWKHDEVIGTENKLNTSEKLITVVIPLSADMKMRTNLKAYRVHGGVAWEIPAATPIGGAYVWKANYELPGDISLTKDDNVGPNDEYVEFTADYAILHLNKFSTYAIAYTPSAPSSGKGGSSSSQNTGNQNITVPNAKDGVIAGGKITTDKVNGVEGDKVTVTVTPDAGYKLDSITVVTKDGEKIQVTESGSNTYTFIMPGTAVSITPVFVKIVATPTETGVSRWFDLSNHLSYINGYPEGDVRSLNNMTRAEAAQMFFNLMRTQEVSGTKTFSDVSAGAWYEKAVSTMADLGLVGGYEDGTFRPNNKITRAEFAAMAMRFAELKGGKAIFADVSANHWAYQYILTAADYGWIGGYEDGTFRPEVKITRAEVVTIVNRMLYRFADKSYVDENAKALVQFTDLSDKTLWYYYDMREATNAHDHQLAGGEEVWTALD